MLIFLSLICTLLKYTEFIKNFFFTLKNVISLEGDEGFLKLYPKS